MELTNVRKVVFPFYRSITSFILHLNGLEKPFTTQDVTPESVALTMGELGASRVEASWCFPHFPQLEVIHVQFESLGTLFKSAAISLYAGSRVRG
jgi:hypothetical protein